LSKPGISNYCSNSISISHRLLQSFEYDPSNAIASRISVGAVIEAMADSIRAEERHSTPLPKLIQIYRSGATQKIG
jgi:hypothetical protein